MNDKNSPETALKPSLSQGVYEWLQTVVTAIVVCILIFIFVVRIVNVYGSSMVPTLHDRDKIIISNLFYEPEQGDIVVLTKRSFSEISIVKRVIAVGGQTVDIDFARGVVTVDGEELDEPYIAELTHRNLGVDFPLKVEEGYIFVMGDNRNASTDSRDRRIGLVDKRCVIGQLVVRLFPLSQIGKVE